MQAKETFNYEFVALTLTEYAKETITHTSAKTFTNTKSGSITLSCQSLDCSHGTLFQWQVQAQGNRNRALRPATSIGSSHARIAAALAPRSSQPICSQSRTVMVAPATQLAHSLRGLFPSAAGYASRTA